MSCPRDRDSASRRGRKNDRLDTSTCKSNCPGRKKRCPDEYNCPYQNGPSSSGQSSRSDKPDSNSSAPRTKQALTELKCPKTDLRIELYIHQLPPVQKEFQDVSQSNARVSIVDSHNPEGSRRRSSEERSTTNEEFQQDEAGKTTESDVETRNQYAKDTAKSKNSIPSENIERSFRQSHDKRPSASEETQQNENVELSKSRKKREVETQHLIDVEAAKNEDSLPFENQEGFRRRSNGKRPSLNENSQAAENKRDGENETQNIDATKADNNKKYESNKNIERYRETNINKRPSANEESRKSSTAQSSEEMREMRGGGQNKDDSEGEKNATVAPQESRKGSNSNRSNDRKIFDEIETDQPNEPSRSEEALLEDNIDREENETSVSLEGSTEDPPDKQMSVDQSDLIEEGDIVVQKAGQLQTVPQGPVNSIRIPGSNINSNYDGKVNKGTDTSEDGNQIVSYPSEKVMVDESTQV